MQTKQVKQYKRKSDATKFLNKQNDPNLGLEMVNADGALVEDPKQATVFYIVETTVEEDQVLRKSAVKSPVKLVHQTCDEYYKAALDRGMKLSRKEVIAFCTDKLGVAFFTARTQYQAWYKAKKEELGVEKL